MFDWLGDLWTSISDATSTVDWGSVATDSLTTSLAGAAVGALASAVTDGDLGEGLLYGAAGGLVAGGLMEFGDQFSSNWSWAGNQQPTGLASTVDVDLGIDLQQELEGFDVDIPEWAVETTPTQSSYMSQFTPGWLPQEKSWMEVLGPSALTVGGNMLAGAFAADPVDQQKELMQMGYDREDEKQGRATSALASTYVPRGAAVMDKSQVAQEDFQDIKEAVTV